MPRHQSTLLLIVRQLIHHDTELATDSLRGQVLSELGLHNSAVAVGSGDLAPNGSVLGASLVGLCLVDVGDSLAQVETGRASSSHSLDLQQRSVGVLRSHTSLVARHDSSAVQSHRLNSSGALLGSLVCHLNKINLRSIKQYENSIISTTFFLLSWAPV